MVTFSRLINTLKSHPCTQFYEITSLPILLRYIKNDFLGLYQGISEQKKKESVETIRDLFSKFSTIKMKEYVGSIEFMILIVSYIKNTHLKRVQQRQLLLTECD